MSKHMIPICNIECGVCPWCMHQKWESNEDEKIRGIVNWYIEQCQIDENVVEEDRVAGGNDNKRLTHLYKSLKEKRANCFAEMVDGLSYPPIQETIISNIPLTEEDEDGVVEEDEAEGDYASASASANLS